MWFVNKCTSRFYILLGLEKSLRRPFNSVPGGSETETAFSEWVSKFPCIAGDKEIDAFQSLHDIYFSLP